MQIDYYTLATECSVGNQIFLLFYMDFIEGACFRSIF
jgi:hypothetical protein